MGPTKGKKSSNVMEGELLLFFNPVNFIGSIHHHISNDYKLLVLDSPSTSAAISAAASATSTSVSSAAEHPSLQSEAAVSVTSAASPASAASAATTTATSALSSTNLTGP